MAIPPRPLCPKCQAYNWLISEDTKVDPVSVKIYLEHGGRPEYLAQSVRSYLVISVFCGDCGHLASATVIGQVKPEW